MDFLLRTFNMDVSVVGSGLASLIVTMVFKKMSFGESIGDGYLLRK